ncbi:MAG: aminoglycoside phosphotransferase family protein [Patescibacteria group bacterium]
MDNYLLRIEKMKKSLTILQKENFKIASNGTHHKVYISNKYVIRFRDDNQKILAREVKLLKQLNHPLIPRVLWSGYINKSFVMLENRLPGKTLDLLWKILPKKNQLNIINQIIQFLQYIKTQNYNYVYSVNTGKKYNNFKGYLTNNIKQKVASIKKIKQTNDILKELILVIKKPEVQKFFSNQEKITLVHGDLIIHNLLSDGKNLTGVIDWELALYGVPDYDLFRLFYYEECAKAYQEQDTDESFEAEFLNMLNVKILKSNLIKSKKKFQKKYQLVNAIFFLNALYWAVNSDNRNENINELKMLWKKRSGVKYICT